MASNFSKAMRELTKMVDFLRFGISQGNSNAIFLGHGTDTLWDEMVALIFDSLHLPYDIDPLIWQSTLTPDERTLLCERMEKRIIQRIPVPYLTNKAYFCDLSFYVDDRVLIPRSPIAELIKQNFFPWIEEDMVENILDLCTGSGCIAIACCHAFPDVPVDAVDISPDALVVAEINRASHQMQHQLSLIESDCFAHVPQKTYDIIVSNPPYVSQEEMQTLPEEYNHEPELALEAPNHGLAIVENILKNAGNYLSEHGILVVEVGNTEEALVKAYPDIPFVWLEFDRGGHGVFLLTAEQVKEAAKYIR